MLSHTQWWLMNDGWWWLIKNVIMVPYGLGVVNKPQPWSAMLRHRLPTHDKFNQQYSKWELWLAVSKSKLRSPRVDEGPQWSLLIHHNKKNSEPQSRKRIELEYKWMEEKRDNPKSLYFLYAWKNNITVCIKYLYYINISHMVILVLEILLRNRCSICTLYGSLMKLRHMIRTHEASSR